MASSSWWLPEKHQDLSQGDIISGLPLWVANSPLTYVEKTILPGGRPPVWGELKEPKRDKDGFSHLTIRSRSVVGVVLTHDCELDKENSKQRIQLAAASNVEENLNAEERTKVMNQGSLRLLVLPEIPAMGTYYADMRLIFTVDKRIVTENLRVASMTEEAKIRLQNQIIAYFVDRARPNH